ncbi:MULTISPECIES: substrate-binding domain-containing protein [Rhizobium]|jgi:simple sugar transport system substrate-binding protein|uniref:substrate-binding domain-containing protein n=1 Tax=Rhizobium TaxID=379 RepID=UPI00036E9817|nr:MULTISPECIES: substrate-binding domain-containing protein [Rhizobium]KZS50439.1 sugar ABC transporter substrate-binding protein [Rhizobium anhuiense bv. trifolii]MBA8832478.1 simple sugar transport system substrate-binding protein [Rhizobium leguminosarum]MBB3742885.1 simple sugar transport system substrate-binding protein [Rhizobium sp. BK591]MDH6276134.1 simple sugar transport system substrate-binding protein [Rhizobium leguminosarum]MVO92465.1 substrate-binding domain-containing protein 
MSFSMRAVRGLLAGAVFVLGASSVLAANIAVVGGKTDDEFWSRIKKGVDDARLVVEKNGGSVSYLQLQTYDNLGPDAAQLVRTAISQGVTGIVVPDWVPEAEDEAIKAAVAAGIKVILMNAGNIDKARELGAINYVGSDEYTAGKAGGEYFASKGAKNVICVNTLPGAANQEARCKGVIDGITGKGGTGKQLPLPATSFGDQTAIAEAVKATLLQDDTIDGVLNVGASDADAAASGIAQANKVGKVAHGTFDLNASGLARIKDGSQTFAIDQQPYLQSLLGVSLLASHIDYGTNLPTAPVLTGPGIVDAANIDATLAGVKEGAR